MVTLNIEILEAYASIEDQPDDLLYLRSLSRHLKVDLCVDLLVNILSGLTPMEAFQLFERACKRSKKLVNVQAWDEALLLQLCQPDQVLFGPTEVDGQNLRHPVLANQPLMKYIANQARLPLLILIMIVMTHQSWVLRVINPCKPYRPAYSAQAVWTRI
ncbi:hypothetical protein V6Z77_003584 [Aspergillus fumigatus]